MITSHEPEHQITETVSKKRGRPAKYSAVMLQQMSNLADGQSRRCHQNWLNMGSAVDALGPDGDFAWISPARAEVMAGTANMRITILQHLGRLCDEDLIRETARVICDQKMKTRAAIDYIRRVRNEPDRPVSVLDLTHRLAVTIDRYTATHGWDRDKVLAAIDNLRECVDREAE